MKAEQDAAHVPVLMWYDAHMWARYFWLHYRSEWDDADPLACVGQFTR